MIVVDTSAVVAILVREPEREALLRCLIDSSASAISASSVVECSLVLRGLRRLSDNQAEETLDRFITDAELTVEPVTLADMRLAREGHIRFGKGTGHRAQLNFGDCFAYALAKRLEAPLLFKGNDFKRTDIASAI